MKKRNLKELRLSKKSVANFMFDVKGARQGNTANRTKSALPLCPGCHSIPYLHPECDTIANEK